MRPPRPASPIRLGNRLPGYGAKTAWNQSPEHTSTLRGIRGEVARVYTPEITLNRPVRLLHPRYPLYIAPKENHVFVIGATQIESESQAPASVRSGLELLSALYAVHPAFGEADILEIAAGLRPTLNHHNPKSATAANAASSKSTAFSGTAL